MVTAGKDQVLLPAFSKGMEDLVRKSRKEKQHDDQSLEMNLMSVFIDHRSWTWAEDTSRTVDTGRRWKDQLRLTASWYHGFKKHTRRLEVLPWPPNCEGGRREGRRVSGRKDTEGSNETLFGLEQNKKFILCHELKQLRRNQNKSRSLQIFYTLVLFSKLSC